MSRGRNTRLSLLAVALVVPIGTASHASAKSADSVQSTDVIVIARPTSAGAAANALRTLGGQVTRDLPIIGGFSATIDSDRVDDLRAVDSVLAVSADATVAPTSVDPTLGYDPAETSSLSAITQIVGAQKMWAAGYTGAGIDVAVIDTGVSRVPGLDLAGKVIDGPDLSFDSIEPTLVNRDAFGHGTHMAGIIAGTDVASGAIKGKCSTCLNKSAFSDTKKFVGVAPGARIVSVKVGAFDGAADVSQVIAAIDWVVQHRKDPGVNIRVLNLSFGTDSVQQASLDPLVFAAEQAWKAGIVVVAAAGNDGLATTALASPAISPAIIAVGATDPRGTLTTEDDSVPSFAQHGSYSRGIDVVAPGVSVISLRVPGSFVDQNVSVGKVGTRFQRASGTSQATAVVSGMAALILSKFPNARPDDVKAFLKANAQPVSLLEGGYAGDLTSEFTNQFGIAVNTWYSGSGSVAIDPAAQLVSASAAAPAGTGLGTLEASRGSYHVSNGTSQLIGERDIFGSPWNPATMAALTANQQTWVGGVWNGARWTGDGWSGARWSGSVWTGVDWSGARWSGARWSAMIWDGARWSGARWSGSRWTSGTWEGARWSGARWSDASWS